MAEAPRATGAVGYRVVAVKGGGVRFVPVGPAGDIMPFRSVVTAAGAAGSIAATALDTALWMRAYAGGTVLSPDTQRQQLADVAATKALGATIPYGLGIQARALAGPRRTRALRPLPGIPERRPLSSRTPGSRSRS